MTHASSEMLSHTAEARVRVRAPSFGELAAEAGRALARLETGTAQASPDGPWRDIEIQSRDREALLVDWLNDLIYLAETERWIGVEFEVGAATDTSLTMRARGVTVDAAPARVKAATFHGLRIGTTPDGLEAEVIFDV